MKPCRVTDRWKATVAELEDCACDACEDMLRVHAQLNEILERQAAADRELAARVLLRQLEFRRQWLWLVGQALRIVRSGDQASG